MFIIRLISSRVAASLMTLVFVSAVIFVSVEILPGDVASRTLGRDATAESLAALRAQLKLNQPAVVRYFAWLGNAVGGQFSTSLTSHRPVSDIIRPRILNTLMLSCLAFLFYIPMSLIPACFQAAYHGRKADHIISFITLLAMSFPDFLIGTIFLVVFVLYLGAFPATSIVDVQSTWLEYLRALVLPALTLSIVMSVYAIRMLRNSLIEVFDAEYIRTARLNGLHPIRVLFNHALRNAIVPTLNVTALNIAYLIGGVVIVEKLFSFPGFGSLIVDSLQLRDVPVIEASILLSAAFYICANLLADIASVLLNPKLRK
jgi:peptide/nickel transport system permease protein